jgi:hypothetical protein
VLVGFAIETVGSVLVGFSIEAVGDDCALVVFESSGESVVADAAASTSWSELCHHIGTPAPLASVAFSCAIDDTFPCSVLVSWLVGFR